MSEVDPDVNMGHAAEVPDEGRPLNPPAIPDAVLTQIAILVKRHRKGIEAPVLYNLKSDIAESTDVSAANPEVVQELLNLAQSTRAELGEFMQRSSAQRPTGSLFPEAPVISHEKGWGILDQQITEAITEEKTKRYPNVKLPRRKRK